MAAFEPEKPAMNVSGCARRSMDTDASHNAVGHPSVRRCSALMAACSSFRPRAWRRKDSVSLALKRNCAGSISSSSPRARSARGRSPAPSGCQPHACAPRQALDKLPDQANDGRVLERLEIIKKKGEGAMMPRHPVHQRKRLLAGIRARMVSGTPGGAVQHLGQRDLERAEKAGGVIVGAIQRQPDRRYTRRLEPRPALQHGSGLAEARRRAHQHEPHETRRADRIADR